MKSMLQIMKKNIFPIILILLDIGAGIFMVQQVIIKI